MGDTKGRYTETAAEYREAVVPNSEIDQIRYDHSKQREALYNENWKRHPVNINDIVARFAPGAIGQRKGVKMVFAGERYEVRADLPSGYLRLFDKKLKKFVLLNGTPCEDRNLTHFKILRKEEM